MYHIKIQYTQTLNAKDEVLLEAKLRTIPQVITASCLKGSAQIWCQAHLNAEEQKDLLSKIKSTLHNFIASKQAKHQGIYNKSCSSSNSCSSSHSHGTHSYSKHLLSHPVSKNIKRNVGAIKHKGLMFYKNTKELIHDDDDESLQNEDFVSELKAHKKNAIISIGALIAFELLKRFSPTLFMSTALIRSLGVILIAKDLFKSGIGDALKDLRPNADTLTVTAVVSSIIAKKPESSLSLLALSNFAECLTLMAAQKARKNISSLVALDKQEVWVQNEQGMEVKIPVKDVSVGMEVSIHCGEKICVDGVVIKGTAAVDQSAITGESIPATKNVGDNVYAGSNIRLGDIKVKVTKVGDDTSIARIVHMVENAQNRRAPIQNYANTMATALVPVSFIAASIVYLITKDWQRVLNMLFIDFSCGLKLSTATAISAAISRSAKEGILVKGGSFIEKAANIDTVVLDKTGTITKGKPEIISFTPCNNFTEDFVLKIAVAAESQSSHPLAVALIDEAKKRNLTIPRNEDSQTIIARGIRSKVFIPIEDYEFSHNVEPNTLSTNENYNDNAHTKAKSKGRGKNKTLDKEQVTKASQVLVGSLKFMQESEVQDLNLVLENTLPASTFVYVAIDNKLAGVFEISDPIRETFKRSVNILRNLGVEEVFMLTGDNEKAANAIATKLGIDGYKAEVLPEDKANYVCEKQHHCNVLMVGDGINDAPALAYADIGVAMGAACTETAMESADVTINSDNPRKLPQFIEIGQKTMNIVQQNFAVTIAVNTAAMMLGALGFINPLTASIVHNASTLGVVLNSARILIYQKKGQNLINN